jgi:hypothetical protein
MAKAIPCPPYTCVESPVEWIAIDALAILTVFWIIISFVYKGVKGRNVMRYPQIHMMIPYPEWEKKLLAEKPAMGAGRVVAAFFKTLFVDVLAMGILKCEYGRSEREVVRTRTAKRIAKLLMVWGFVFAGISTALAYLMFPHNKIVLDLSHLARASACWAGVYDYRRVDLALRPLQGG